jgi:flavorubredoxin
MIPAQLKVPGLPRRLADRVHWLGDCTGRAELAGLDLHSYMSAYVVAGDECSAMVDTGHPKDWAVVSRQLDELHEHGVPAVRYLVPTHPEIPHSGNLGRLLRRYPEAVVAGEIRDYALVFPQSAGRLVPMQAGAELDLGHATLRLVEGVLHDLEATTWAYFVEGAVLFPGDGFAYMHEHTQGQCGKVAEEAPTLDIEAYTAMFAGAALFWTRYTDMGPVIAYLDEFLMRHPCSVIAPGHGLPITDPDRMMPRIRQGLLLGAGQVSGAAGSAPGQAAESTGAHSR